MSEQSLIVCSECGKPTNREPDYSQCLTCVNAAADRLAMLKSSEISDTEILEGAYDAACTKANYWKTRYLLLKEKMKAPEPVSGAEEGLREDLEQLIRVCLTNPNDTIGFVAANYPKHYAEAIDKNKGKTLASEQPDELPVAAMAEAALKKHAQLLTDIFMHLPTDIIDDNRERVAVGFIGAIVETAIHAAYENTPKRAKTEELNRQKKVKCSPCNGSGGLEIYETSSGVSGWIDVQCSKCHGQGYVEEKA